MNHPVIKVATLPDDFPLIQQIRYQVFQVEQGVPTELEFDGKDEQAEHILAHLDDKPVGTARIRCLNAQTVKVERVAVLQAARGSGIGRKIMEFILQHLTEADVVEILIHAQEPVKDFYLKLGFEPEGEIFAEAGIPHVKMRKLLK